MHIELHTNQKQWFAHNSRLSIAITYTKVKDHGQPVADVAEGHLPSESSAFDMHLHRKVVVPTLWITWIRP